MASSLSLNATTLEQQTLELFSALKRAFDEAQQRSPTAEFHRFNVRLSTNSRSLVAIQVTLPLVLSQSATGGLYLGTREVLINQPQPIAIGSTKPLAIGNIIIAV